MYNRLIHDLRGKPRKQEGKQAILCITRDIRNLASTDLRVQWVVNPNASESSGYRLCDKRTVH